VLLSSSTGRSVDLTSIIMILVMALLYFMTGKISLGIASENYIVTIVIFAAEGFALAGVLIFGKKVLPGIFLGQFVLALSEHIPVLPAMGVSAVNTIEAFIAWNIFQYFQFNKRLRHPKELFTLFFTIAFVLQPFSALSSTFILYLSSIVKPEDFLSTLFSWWFGNTLGQMLWTPLLLLLYTERKKIHYLELFLFILLFLLYAWLVFTILPIDNLSISIILTLPIAVYVTIKKGLLYASVMIVILAMVSILSTYMHTGIFSRMSMMDNIININFYILSHILIVLGIGSLYCEAEDTKQALAKLNRSLEEEVAQQVRKLNEQNLIMTQQARLASMGEMLGMIAHQWRQPLNTINSNIAVIQKLISENHSKDPLLEEKLNNITNHTAFMSDTIEDFSGFFHPNKQAISFNPCHTLKRAIKLIGKEADKIDITLSCPETLTVYSYENEYLQVVLSILHNAIENFTANRTHNPALQLSVKRDGAYVILSIQDNGGGIRANRIESIFDPYFTTNHTKKNSGLGLYMAKLLIEESMRGRLTVKNKNEGACFKISLPKGNMNEQ
jgi:signal transduction histidine kinase